MKLFTLIPMLAFASSAFAGEMYQHIQMPMLDAYVDSSIDKEPAIPGLGRVRHSISVSITTTDIDTSYFAVYLKVELEDGTIHPISAALYRESGGPTTARFALGERKPVKIVEFYIVRLHPESADHMIWR